MNETVNLNGDEVARIIELAFDYGWTGGQYNDQPFEGSLADAKWRINQWLIDNGFLVY